MERKVPLSCFSKRIRSKEGEWLLWERIRGAVWKSKLISIESSSEHLYDRTVPTAVTPTHKVQCVNWKPVEIVSVSNRPRANS